MTYPEFNQEPLKIHHASLQAIASPLSLGLIVALVAARLGNAMTRSVLRHVLRTESLTIVPSMVESSSFKANVTTYSYEARSTIMTNSSSPHQTYHVAPAVSPVPRVLISPSEILLVMVSSGNVVIDCVG